MNHRRPRKHEPNFDGGAPGGEHWGLDPQDVRRYARRMRQERTVGPLGKAVRVLAVVLVLVGAFAVTWNFATLRGLRLDFSALTDAFSRGDAPAGARPSDEPGTEVIEDSSIAGGVSLPTSIKTGEPAAETEGVEPGAEAPVAAAPVPTESAPTEPRTTQPAATQPAPAEPAAPTPRETEPVVAATDPPPAARPPPPPPEPEVPAGPETFGFGLDVMNVSEASASAAILVLRDGGRRGVSFITWWTTDGTATAGSDFARLEPRVERFGAGEQNRTLHVPIVGDRTVEGAENFYVHVAVGDSGRALDEVAKIEVVITDDD
jgi:hypothetical protein